MSFADICMLTTVQGTIVRCITRLDEVCREVRNAARIIGDPTCIARWKWRANVSSETLPLQRHFTSAKFV